MRYWPDFGRFSVKLGIILISFNHYCFAGGAIRVSNIGSMGARSQKVYLLQSKIRYLFLVQYCIVRIPKFMYLPNIWGLSGRKDLKKSTSRPLLETLAMLHNTVRG